MGRIVISVACLYFFICSLDVMATAGRLVAGKSAGSIFNNSKMLTNPIVGLMLGEMENVPFSLG